ncbi:MAG: M4 family metallopeptidase [Bacteroidia bacterium]|nr:M4 family metallopeptidase [Bacteroidia bacterium]
MKNFNKNEAKCINFCLKQNSYYTKLTTIFLLIFCAIEFTNAQTTPKLQDPTNQFIIDKSFKIDPAGGIIYFNANELQPGELFTTYFSSTGLSALDVMTLVKTTHDSMLADEDSPAPNLAHNIYKQFYNGVEVEDGNYIEHFCESYVCFTSGAIVEGLDLSVSPEVTENDALMLAKSYSNISTLSRDTLGFPILSKILIINSSGTYKLAWKFTIIGDTDSYNSDIYVDANSGTIIKDESNIRKDNFNHTFYGRKWDMDTYMIGPPWYNPYLDDLYYLFANDNGRNIYSNESYTQDFKNQAWAIEDMAFNNSFTWHSNRQNYTSAHYCVQKAWDFFKNSPYNRNGLSGWGNHLRVMASIPQIDNSYEPDNQQDYILTGFSSSINLNTYDLVGHEFTHGIIHRSHPMPNVFVVGAIAESFSDIFGFMVERYALGYTEDWTIGEDVSVFRNMQFPNSAFLNPSPAYYKQAGFWVEPGTYGVPNETNDFGYIHRNAGVMNKWFYLLSTGGSQPIEILINGSYVLQPTRVVGGIGVDKAARIAYYAMTNFDNFKGNFTTFETVRATTIAAAIKLYGICSNEYNQTCAAWYAVNVGNYCEPCNYAQAWCGQEQQFTSSVKERKNETLKIKLLPNPAKNYLAISIEESNIDLANYNVIITAVDGKIIYNNTYENLNFINIDVSAFTSGIYFVNISSNKWSKNIKFVKE